MPPPVGTAPTPTAAPRASAVALTEMTPGAVAELDQVTDPRSRAVLSSLGLTGGARLRLCRIGDPCIIQVRSTRIGLSKVVAESVYVVSPAPHETR
jgi:Fe2+ transport system protein FeoA